MARKKRSVSFSIHNDIWDRCLRLKPYLPFNWSDLVEEALIKVLEPLELAISQIETGTLSDGILQDLSQLNRTNYLDTESVISEHLVSKPKSQLVKSSKK
jgi:hypothetical protein